MFPEAVPDFTVDVDRLNNVATSDLPTIIDCVNAAHTALNTALSDQVPAFDGCFGGAGDSRPVGLYDGVDGDLSSDVEALTNGLLAGLSQLAQNLGEAKSAVHEIANRYREADGQPPYPSS